MLYQACSNRVQQISSPIKLRSIPGCKHLAVRSSGPFADGTIFHSDESHLSYFKFVGKIIGKAIYE